MDEKRRHARYPIYCRIQYKRENDDERSPAVTMNLSEGGALIPAKDFIDIAADLMIRIFLKKEDFFIKSKVAHVKYEPDKGRYDIGIEFKQRPNDFALKFYEELDAIINFQKRYQEEKMTAISLEEASRKWYEPVP